jgi:hypothetical protein
MSRIMAAPIRPQTLPLPNITAGLDLVLLLLDNSSIL